MTLVTLIVTLALVGLLLWAINAYIPMDGKIKRILNIAVVVFVCIWLLRAFGLFGNLSNVRVGG